MSGALRPYLARSFGFHAAAFAAVLVLGPRAARRPAPVYTIDFVGGPSATLLSAGPPSSPARAAESAAPARVAQQSDPDAVRTKQSRLAPIALPRPSLLRGGRESRAETKSAPSARAAAAPAAATGAGPAQETAAPAGTSGAGISTDLPNFPYPWYISQVRLMLWQAWQKRLPRLDASGTLAFVILRNGSSTDLTVESSSGEAEFDQAALESVRAAAPFPPLPSGFHEPFLKIHLSLKSEEAWR